jgi:hypothetical protein
MTAGEKESGHSLHQLRLRAGMGTKPQFSTLCMFIIHSSDADNLGVILDRLAPLHAEPFWQFTRLKRGRFKLEIYIGGLSKGQAAKMAEEMGELTEVAKVDGRFLNDVASRSDDALDGRSSGCDEPLPCGVRFDGHR